MLWLHTGKWSSYILVCLLSHHAVWKLAICSYMLISFCTACRIWKIVTSERPPQHFNWKPKYVIFSRRRVDILIVMLDSWVFFINRWSLFRSGHYKEVKTNQKYPTYCHSIPFHHSSRSFHSTESRCPFKITCVKKAMKSKGTAKKLWIIAKFTRILLLDFCHQPIPSKPFIVGPIWFHNFSKDHFKLLFFRIRVFLIIIYLKCSSWNTVIMVQVLYFQYVQYFEQKKNALGNQV